VLFTPKIKQTLVKCREQWLFITKQGKRAEIDHESKELIELEESLMD
jgi:hypothetical protein